MSVSPVWSWSAPSGEHFLSAVPDSLIGSSAHAETNYTTKLFSRTDAESHQEAKRPTQTEEDPEKAREIAHRRSGRKGEGKTLNEENQSGTPQILSCGEGR